jgi:formate--tetrahydrofolate ligase
MAILALSTSLADLRARLGRLVVGFTAAGDPVTAEQLRTAGAMAMLLRDALKPNLLETLEGGRRSSTPDRSATSPPGTLLCCADLLGIRTSEVLITEAGFGADMGAERFFNIKCRVSGLRPDAAVLVVTVRALKAHSGRFSVRAGRPLPVEMLAEGPEDVLAGAANLVKQIQNVRLHGVSPVVAINAFSHRPPVRARGDPSGGGRRRRYRSR